MALNSRVYRYQLENVSGTNVLGTITDLVTLSDDNMTIYVDITSWASYYGNGKFIGEISLLERRIIGIYVLSGVLEIFDTKVLKSIGGSTTSLVTFSESLVNSDTELELSATCATPINVFRRATITMIQP